MILTKPISDDLKFSRNDPDDPRLGEFVSDSKSSIALIGYPDDRGIKLNGGRTGASHGPTEIRRILYKLVRPQDVTLFDHGDLILSESLENDHELASQFTAKNEAQFWITLGGGHDWGYSDGKSFIEKCLKLKQRPWIINFDAHLDVRNTQNGFNSGTPFFRLLDAYSHKFDFYEFGIQKHCNSKYHTDYVKKNNVGVFYQDDINDESLPHIIKKLTSKHKDQPLFVSFDIDVLSTAEAPGCSQSWPVGLSLKQCLTALSILAKNSNWERLGIYEVSPSLDVQNITSKSAALICYLFIKEKSKNKAAMHD